MKTKKSIYLDVCELSRPFDDQSYLRIRLETEAVNLILSKIQNGEYTLAVSPVHWEEIKGYSDKAGASASQCAYRGSIMKLMVVF